MADNDPLAPSLSEEESELILGAKAPPTSGVAKTKKGKASNSPTRQKDAGFKFNAEQQNLKPNFDFASEAAKNGQATNNHSNSSSEGEDQEGFELLNGDGGDTPTTPSTPSKLPTPQKRTADLADTGNDQDGTGGGANGSPPSSPAPKKHKVWDDFVKEDDEKKSKTEQQPLPTADYWIARKMVAGVILVLVIPVFLAMYYPALGIPSNVWPFTIFQQPSNVQPKYTWNKANSAFVKNLTKIQHDFPKQNRETWIQLRASIASTLSETEPEHPAAITVLVPPSLSKFGICFVEKIANILNTAVAPVLQKDAKSSHPAAPQTLTPETFKGSSITTIRNTLESYFLTQGKAVIALDVDKIEKESDLLLFHGLCDNFRAVDNRATLLFPVNVPQHIYDKYEWTHARGGDISQDYLNTAFAKVVSADTGPALVARIADGVIVLNEGDEC